MVVTGLERQNLATIKLIQAYDEKTGREKKIYSKKKNLKKKEWTMMAELVWTMARSK